uniref:RNase H type-1 domain-containing protein n=1 Tax=Oryza sativa subsp. japonica TaxID=39947 RepID=Q6Z3N0_ORYSJ|nr:hypothetical protein [Oryza sativa Japonica Group]BAD05566.1 hypothetical protein [Oryza sativa Japonica Group]
MITWLAADNHACMQRISNACGSPVCKVDRSSERVDARQASFLVLVTKPALSPAKSRPNVQAQRKWHPPILGELKLNFDGAFFDEGKTGGWGFVVRDHGGHCVLAGAGRIELVHDALCAEAMACLYALRAAANNGISHVSVETDCSVLVRALKSADYDQATAGVIFNWNAWGAVLLIDLGRRLLQLRYSLYDHPSIP